VGRVLLGILAYPPHMAAVPIWLLAELGPALRLATALTGSPARAADLVAETLVRDATGDATWAVAAAADPEPLLRAATVRRFLRERPRPDPGVTGLDALPRPARASVVLRDGERLTTAEIATIVDRPVRQVAADLAAHPGGYDLEIADRYAHSPAAEEVASRYPAAVHRARTRRRHRRGWVGLGLVVAATVAAAAVLLPSVLLRVDPPEVRVPGEWRFTHHLRRSSGWSVDQRILNPDHEYTVVEAASGVEPTRCIVSLGGGPLSAGVRSRGRPERIAHWQGYYVERRFEEPRLTWEYAPGAVATVSCFQDVAPATLVSVAEAVRFEDSRVRLPFMIGSLPTGYEVASIDERGAGTRVGVTLQPTESMAVPSVIVWYGGDEPADRCVSADGSRRTGGEIGPTGGPGVCLTASWSAEEAPYALGRVQRALDQVQDRLRLAPDLTDRTTWFDALDLPG
jgi:hypothetical protein